MKFLLVLLLTLSTSSCLSEADEVPAPSSSTSSSDAEESGSNSETTDGESGVNSGIAALHDGKTTCDGCHEKDRPETAHPPSGDCITCHSYPDWSVLN